MPCSKPSRYAQAQPLQHHFQFMRYLVATEAQFRPYGASTRWDTSKHGWQHLVSVAMDVASPAPGRKQYRGLENIQVLEDTTLYGVLISQMTADRICHVHSVH